jgi:hypothetical protein
MIHQLVHGYEHGHRTLAGSTELSRDEMDLVTRLSDLSGSMIPGQPIEPYVSLYPLPSKTYYAVAKTWEDRSAPRAGCVLTHTLLVPAAAWANSPNLASIAALHRLPQRSDLQDFTATLSTKAAGRLDTIEDIGRDVFIGKFFGEGIRPLVWFGLKKAERYAWRIAAALWPALRSGFACCSLALQPRTLDERPFDLTFAPASARSRFAEFGATNIVDASSESGALSASVEPWARQWRDIVFSDIGERSAQVFALSAGLEAAPNAVRKVFLFLDLQERAASVPLAAIGALDVLESLGSAQSEARALVTQLVNRALSGVRNAPQSWALEMLCLVGLRLDRVEPSLIDRDIDNLISLSVRDCVASAPAGGVALAERFSTRDLGRLPRSFVRGLADAITASPNLQSLLALAQAHHVGRNLVEVSPAATRGLLLAGRSLDLAFGDVLSDWYKNSRDQVSRAALRVGLVPILEAVDDARLLQELLKDVQPQEVIDLCSGALDQRVAPELGRMFAEFVGEPYQAEVIVWSRGKRLGSCKAITFAVAGALLLSADGLAEAYTYDGAENLVAALVDRALHRAAPSWLIQACNGHQLWACLLRGIEDPFVASTVSRLVGVIERSAIARTAGSLLQLARAPASIQSHAVRQMLLDHLSNGCRVDLKTWVGTAWVVNIVAKDPLLLRTVISDETAQATDLSGAWVNAWRTIEVVSASIQSAAALVVELCSLLLWRRPWPWPIEVGAIWREVLANLTHDEARYEAACTQAIKFAFDNTRIPLAPAVAEAFFSVHAAALRNQSRPSWDFLGVTNWDKGGELRRRLVDAFYYGEWEPQWFVLAAREPWLLRKLCIRMMKQWKGVAYLERAMSGLDPGPLSYELADILRHPEYREEWD